MGNEHTVDYHPSPSELTSRIHPLIFLWTPKGFISAEYFFLKSYFARDVFLKILFCVILQGIQNLAPALPESRRGPGQVSNLWFYDYWKRYLWGKNWIFSFLLISPSKTLPQAEGNYPFPRKAFSENLFFPHQGGGRIMKRKKWPKLNLRGY